MKKIYMLVAAAMMAACASAQVEEVLDLSEGSFTFTGEMWAETYNEEKPAIEVAPFSLSHLTSGDSWGGSFWEGFTICKSANNTEGGLAHQWSNMAGGGIGSVSESGSVTVDANAPYVLAYFVNWFGNENCTVSFTDGQKREAVGMYVVNTTTLSSAEGYRGKTPLEVHIKNNRIRLEILRKSLVNKKQ